ncbi:MAG TPA: chemotaxis protein CheA [bacterium]|nr:chemotaxis protein CheA [bacterium]HOL47597.1 chemotaxis protein CheA [bacterium]HPQ18720.1 chemotaxis protein CheA [bacterium]
MVSENYINEIKDLLKTIKKGEKYQIPKNKEEFNSIFLYCIETIIGMLYIKDYNELGDLILNLIKYFQNENNYKEEKLKIFTEFFNDFEKVLETKFSEEQIRIQIIKYKDTFQKKEEVKGKEETKKIEQYEEIEIKEWDRAANENLLGDFIEETKEIIDNLEKSFINLENDAENMEVLNSIFRAMHTLKGNSAAIDLQVLNTLAHKSENILDKVRMQELKIDSNIFDILFECVDYIKRILNKIIEKENPNIDISLIVKKLNSILEKKPIEVEEAEAKIETKKEILEKKESAEPKAGKKEVEQLTTSIRVNIKKLDTIMNLVGEIIIDKIRFNKDIMKFYELSEMLKIILNELEINKEEYIHTINRIKNEDISRHIKDMNKTGSLFKIQKIINEQLEKIDALNIKSISMYNEKLKSFEEIFNDNLQQAMYLDEHLNLIIKELRESVMQLRLVPIAQLFDKMPRIIRDNAKLLKKKIKLEIIGSEVELDKTVIEKLNDPFVHILRNSADHGIETPEERIKKGKPEEGIVRIKAEHKNNQAIITIEDDGKGIDPEKIKESAIKKNIITPEQAKNMSDEEAIELIFLPGFSSAEKVTEISGRGVGMDVVLTNIKQLNGSIKVTSEIDKGTIMKIILPLTISLINVQIVEISKRLFAIPLTFIKETITLEKNEIKEIGSSTVMKLRGEIIPVIRLSKILEINNIEDNNERYIVNIIEMSDKKIGLIIDKIIGHQEIVIKSLGNILKNIKHISGATILGEGTVIFILDIMGIFNTAKSITERSKNLGVA